MDSKELETVKECMNILTKDLQDKWWAIVSVIMFKTKAGTVRTTRMEINSTPEDIELYLDKMTDLLDKIRPPHNGLE